MLNSPILTGLSCVPPNSRQRDDGRWDRYGYLATVIAYDPTINEKNVESIRSDIASIDGGFAVGLDVPFDRLMVGRLLAKNGSSFRKARDSFERTVLERLAGQRAFPGICAP